MFSQKYFGQIYESYPKIGIGIYKHYINEVSKILRSLGININTVPVLDRLYGFTNRFLKTRIFSSKIQTIKTLSNICVNTYRLNKISTVIKHIPGHGLAKSDLIKNYQLLIKSKNFLLKNDFNCFKNTKSKFAMTAHILFKEV